MRCGFNSQATEPSAKGAMTRGGDIGLSLTRFRFNSRKGTHGLTAIATFILRLGLSVETDDITHENTTYVAASGFTVYCLTTVLLYTETLYYIE